MLRRLWHISQSDAAESRGDWFAAAHHLGQLHQLADPGDNLAALRVRRMRVRALGNGSKSLQPAEKASAEEQALADAYHLLDLPLHAVPWWLGPERHGAMLRALHGAEAGLLRANSLK